jgi:predicted phage terminase large subunit-like protein
VLAEHLEAVSTRQIRQLVINIPPGHMKSLMVNVFWPCWHWSWDPGHKWLFSSHDLTLVHRDAELALSILRSETFQTAFPECRLRDLKVSATGLYYTTVGGRRLSTSIGGRGVGWHAHTKVCDDPVKPLAAHSRTHRALENANVWWSNTMVTRNVDPKLAASVIVMQRIAEKDLSGYLLDQGYEHLMLPLEFRANAFWDRGSTLTRANREFGDHRTEEGEILWRERIGAKELDEIKKALATPSNISAQLDQNPTPETGGFVEREWFSEYGEIPEGCTYFQTWDLAAKGSAESHSRVSGTLWATDWQDLYLVDEFVRHLNYSDTKREFAKRQGKRWDANRQRAEVDLDAQKRFSVWARAHVVLVEEKAAGIDLIAEMRSAFPGIVPTNPRDSKEDRMRMVSGIVEGRKVRVPSVVRAPWLTDWLAELVGFPRMAYDDRVDTFTMAAAYFESKESRAVRNLKILANRAKRPKNA